MGLCFDNTLVYCYYQFSVATPTYQKFPVPGDCETNLHRKSIWVVNNSDCIKKWKVKKTYFIHLTHPKDEYIKPSRVFKNLWIIYSTIVGVFGRQHLPIDGVAEPCHINLRI